METSSECICADHWRTGAIGAGLLQSRGSLTRSHPEMRERHGDFASGTNVGHVPLPPALRGEELLADCCAPTINLSRVFASSHSTGCTAPLVNSLPRRSASASHADSLPSSSVGSRLSSKRWAKSVRASSGNASACSRRVSSSRLIPHFRRVLNHSSRLERWLCRYDRDERELWTSGHFIRNHRRQRRRT